MRDILKEVPLHCQMITFLIWKGYASLGPGDSDAREKLTSAIDDKLFFAGEATAFYTNPQTVHGAMETGFRVASEVSCVL